MTPPGRSLDCLLHVAPDCVTMNEHMQAPPRQIPCRRNDWLRSPERYRLLKCVFPSMAYLSIWRATKQLKTFVQPRAISREQWQ